MKIKQVEDCIIKLGQNAEENTDLVKNSNCNFYWVHLDAFPSGHAVIESESPNKNVIYEACQFCLENTKYKRLKHVYFNVTQIKNLKTTDICGEVEFLSNKKVFKY